MQATLDGALPVRGLDTGTSNRGPGGFLHAWGARRENGQWLVQGKPVDPARRFTIVLTGFLLPGGEVNLGDLTRANPQVRDVQELRDIRRVVIEERGRQRPAGRPRG